MAPGYAEAVQSIPQEANRAKKALDLNPQFIEAINNIANCYNQSGSYEKAIQFYQRWTNDEAFEYINTTMRSIRKVQNDCSLLKLCTSDENIMNAGETGT